MEKMIFGNDYQSNAPVPSAIHLRLNAEMRQQYARIKMAAMRCGLTLADGTPFNGSIQHMFKLLFEAYEDGATEIDPDYNPVENAKTAGRKARNLAR